MKVDIHIKDVCNSRLGQVVKMARLLEINIGMCLIDQNRLVLSITTDEKGLNHLKKGISTIIEDKDKVKIWKS